MKHGKNPRPSREHPGKASRKYYEIKYIRIAKKSNNKTKTQQQQQQQLADKRETSPQNPRNKIQNYEKKKKISIRNRRRWQESHQESLKEWQTESTQGNLYWNRVGGK